MQEQLGHATIELTVSTYGRWLKKKAQGALDRLDSVTVPHSGSKVVEEAAFVGGAVGTPSAGESLIFKHLRWSRRSGLNGRPAVYECEQDVFKKARCFKWFPHFVFEYRGLGTFH